MTYEMYRYIFLGGLIACVIFFAIAVILFFVFRIPKIVSDLSGRTARKAIENIRLQNEQSGDKTYKSSAVNMERGKLTDKISQSGRLISRNPTPFGTGVITEKLSTGHLATEAPAGETTLIAVTDETALLDSDIGMTVALGTPETGASQKFTVEFEITYIHTNEVIE